MVLKRAKRKKERKKERRKKKKKERRKKERKKEERKKKEYFRKLPNQCFCNDINIAMCRYYRNFYAYIVWA